MARHPRPRSVARRALVASGVTAVLSLVGLAPVVLDVAPAPAIVCAPVPAGTTALTPVQAAQAAAAWLATQQQPDGGFEVAGYPGFETPDAILAIAEAGQTGSDWSTAEALAAVRALSVACGDDPLTWMDQWSQSGLTGGEAAKVVVLVAEPLGLSSIAFDPNGDGDPVDLLAIIDDAAEPNGWYGTFNDTIYAALALRLTRGSVPAGTESAIAAGQHPDGGWDYTGIGTSDTPEDINTTAASILALIAAGRAQDDAVVRAGLGYLAARQQPDGGWREDGDAVTNPNATALCALAIRSAGYDPDGSAWRAALPAGAATAAAVTGTPTGALLAAQDPDGHLIGPYDEFGLNTFGTSQGVQGILRTWLVGALPLATPADTTTTTTTVAPTTTTVAVAGRLANSGPRDAATTALVGALALVAGSALVVVGRRRA